MSFILNKFLALLAGVQEEKIPEIRKKVLKNGCQDIEQKYGISKKYGKGLPGIIT